VQRHASANGHQPGFLVDGEDAGEPIEAKLDVLGNGGRGEAVAGADRTDRAAVLGRT
jgi:hypothetical protein